MITRIASIVAVLAMGILVIAIGISESSQSSAGAAPKTGTHPVEKVTICHFTSIHAEHPYNEITIDAKQIVNGNGHGAHVYDIWPTFQYRLHDGTIVTVPSHGNQEILRNHCRIPGEPTGTVSPCPTVTVTVTATPDWKTHPTEHPTQCPTATVTATATATSTVTSTTTATATATVTGPTSTVTVTTPFVPSTDCPPPNLVNVVRGTGKNDNLVGTPCRDGMLGHKGNDLMLGAAANDVLLGGRGRDRLDGGTGTDVLRGGFNNDILVSNDGTPGDRLIGGQGQDLCIIDPGDKAKSCERTITR